jgi:phage gp45-like
MGLPVEVQKLESASMREEEKFDDLIKIAIYGYRLCSSPGSAVVISQLIGHLIAKGYPTFKITFSGS